MRLKQCSGSVTFWYGSGSADPYHGLTNPDPALFVSVLQEARRKKKFSKFFCLLLFADTFTSFFKDKKS
jgi:hypothetical protein